MTEIKKAFVGSVVVHPGNKIDFDYTAEDEIDAKPRKAKVEKVCIKEDGNVVLTCVTDDGYRNFRTDRISRIDVYRGWRDLFRS